MQDPTYPLFPVLSFLGFVLVLIPLPWHLQAWNVGTVMYIIWTAIACLNQFINNVVWRNDAINRAPVFCDISVRLMVAVSVAIPAASLTINRRLYQISRIQAVTTSPKEKRNNMIVDLLVCLGFPIFITIIWFFIQGHRFDLIEQVGCAPATFNTLPSYFLLWMWPLVLGTISMGFCGLTLWSFLQRKREMSKFLSSNNSSLTFSRYFRLMALATMDAFFTVPLASYSLSINVSEGIQPYINLANAHFAFSRVDQVPAVIWRQSKPAFDSFITNRIFIVLCAAIFFAFFGFAEESRRNYMRLFWTVMARFGVHQPAPKMSSSNGIGGSSAMFRMPNLPTMSMGSSSGDLDEKVLGGAALTVSLDEKLDPTMRRNHRGRAGKRESFLSSVGNLSSSFSIDLEEQKERDNMGKDEEEDGSRYDEEDDGLSMPDTPIELTGLGLPHLTSTSPTPGAQPQTIRLSHDRTRTSNSFDVARIAAPLPPIPPATTPTRPPRPETLDFDA